MLTRGSILSAGTRTGDASAKGGGSMPDRWSEAWARDGGQGNLGSNNLLGAQVAEGEGEGLEGMQSALGTYDIDAEKTYRQNVYFSAIRIAPAPGAGPQALQKWRAVFGAGNPNMVGRPSAPGRPLFQRSVRGCIIHIKSHKLI